MPERTEPEVKKPKLALEVDFITTAGAATVEVVPENDKVSIAGKTYRVDHDAVFRGRKGAARAVIVEGEASAIPIWGKRDTKTTATQIDTYAHNNLLEQLNAVAKRREPKPAGQVGLYVMLGLVCLIAIGGAVSSHGDFKDLHSEINEVEDEIAVQAGPGASDDVTVITPQTGPGTQPGA